MPFRKFTLLKILSHATLADMESSSLRPTVGRRIALELYSARPLTWLGPMAATICGAIAAGGTVTSGESLLRVAIAILLTDPLLGAWRAAWVYTDWRRPMRGWHATPTRAWMLVPYARLGSPAARFSQWLSSRAKFWREAIVPQVGQSITAIIVTALIALSVALVLGSTVFLLTIAALWLAPIESELGEHRAGRWARAFAEIGMAWLIGDAAISLTFPPIDSTILALLFAMTYRGLLSVSTRPRLGLAIANVAQALAIIFLLARGSVISATIVALVFGAQLLWQTVLRGGQDDAKMYLGRVQWFILAAMVIAALGIPR
jgi:hypothetical protein